MPYSYLLRLLDSVKLSKGRLRMKITKVEVFAARLHLIEPFIISYVRLDDMPTIITRIELDNGIVGWGEAVPDQNVTGETWESTYEVIQKELAPLLIGEGPFNIDAIHRKFNAQIAGVPSAKAALDIALYDAMGKITNQPLYRLIGGQAHDVLYIPQVISIKTPEAMAADAARYVAQGFHHIKIKVGTDAPTDIKRIRAVREAIGEEAFLRVDANQGWDRIEAIQVIQATADCQVEWYEQPVKDHDHKSMREIRATVPHRIMIDEGIHSVQNLIDVIEMRSADMVNIKLMKSGGIYPALAIANLAEAAGMPCQVGSMVESAIATMAGAHLSMSRSIIQTNEMVGPTMFTRDLASVDIKGECLYLSERPGLGIDVDEAYLTEITHHHCLIQ